VFHAATTFFSGKYLQSLPHTGKLNLRLRLPKSVFSCEAILNNPLAKAGFSLSAVCQIVFPISKSGYPATLTSQNSASHQGTNEL
jgi:hypothetical protein